MIFSDTLVAFAKGALDLLGRRLFVLAKAALEAELDVCVVRSTGLLSHHWV